MSEISQNQNQNSDEIDLKNLIFPIWNARKQILFVAMICGILGGIEGFLIPDSYTARSTFLPQTTQSGGAAGSLGGLAALAGINLNSPMSGGDIPPSMYSTVLASEPFRKSILDGKILINGDSLTYRKFLEEQSKKSNVTILSSLKGYTIGLPGKIISIFSRNVVEEVKINEIKEIPTLSDKEYGLLNTVLAKVKIENNTKEGVVSIIVVESDPIIAAQVTKVTEKVLQDWISEHKRKNAKAQYDFIVKQFEEKQKEFFSIQDQLAGYMDRNQNVLSATYQTRLDRLQAEFDLVNTVYSELAKQKEQAAIQLSKDTPTFSVLDPVKVPKEKTGPKRSIYILGSFFSGLILSAGWFLGKKLVQGFFRGMQD
jgi:uncharacterized protein involved in exopolysaccharide biosynthesis